jgi:hypothetical protein
MSRARRLLEELEWAGDIRVSKNPTSIRRLCADLVIDMHDYSIEDLNLRSITNLETGDVFYWRAWFAEHTGMAKQLGLDLEKCATALPHFIFKAKDTVGLAWSPDVLSLKWSTLPDWKFE